MMLLAELSAPIRDMFIGLLCFGSVVFFMLMAFLLLIDTSGKK